jgi:hypothetical protein
MGTFLGGMLVGSMLTGNHTHYVSSGYIAPTGLEIFLSLIFWFIFLGALFWIVRRYFFKK